MPEPKISGEMLEQQGQVNELRNRYAELDAAVRVAAHLLPELTRPVFQGSNALREMQSARDAAIELLARIVRALPDADVPGSSGVAVKP